MVSDHPGGAPISNWLDEQSRNSAEEEEVLVVNMTMATTMEITMEAVTMVMVMEDIITTMRNRDHRQTIVTLMTIIAEEEDHTTTTIGIGRTIMDTVVTMTGLNRLLPVRARVDLEA